MKASVYLGPEQVEAREIDEPKRGEDEVLIRVVRAGLCGTDLHIQNDEYVNCPPVILGHEMSGVVVEVGDAVTRFAVGDRVTSETFKFTCGQCRFCQTGLIGLCVHS